MKKTFNKLKKGWGHTKSQITVYFFLPFKIIAATTHTNRQSVDQNSVFYAKYCTK